MASINGINLNKILKKKSFLSLIGLMLLFLAYQFLFSENHIANQENINNNQVVVNENLNNDQIDIEPAGFTGIKEMNVCKGNSEICYTRQVEFEDGEVLMIYLPDDKIIVIDYSDCQNNYCYVEDENGTEWDLVE